MVEFLTSQMDYIFFVYGLGFFILAAVAFSLARIRDQRVPWLWLCLFGLLHGAVEWVDMLVISYGDLQFLEFIKFLLLASSFICLVEFGRRSAPAIGKKLVPGWMTRILFFAPLIGAFSASPAITMNVTIRYFIGLWGALWAISALVRYRHHLTVRSCGGLRLTIGAMGLYAIVVGLIVPKASFFPASVINQDSFLAVAHMPVQTVRMFCALMMAYGLWRHYVALSRAATPIFSRPARRIEYAIIFVYVALLAAGWYATNERGKQARQEEYARLQLVAELTAGTFVCGHIGPPTTNAEYGRLKTSLIKTIMTSRIVDNAYLVALRGTNLVMLLDITPETSPQFVPPGTVLLPPTAALRATLEGGTGSTECIIPPGTNDGVICTYAPLKEVGSHATIGVLIMQRQADRVARIVSAARLPPILITMLVQAMIILFILVRRRDDERRVTQQVNESRLKEAQRLAHMGHWELDIPANRLIWSDELYLMCERTPVPGAPPPIFRDIVHPDDRVHVETTIALSLKTDVPIEFTHRICMHDGIVKSVLHSCHSFFDANGLPVRMVGIVQDITERVHAESALRENQRVLTTLMSNLPGMAYRCCNDKPWTMTFVSEGCTALTGYAPRDLIGNTKVSYAGLINEDHRMRNWTSIQTAVAARKPFTCLYSIRTADGREKWVWEQGRGVFDDNGTLLFLEGFITDTTERWKMEQELKQSHDFLQVVLDSFPDPIMVIDLDYKVRLVNKAVRALATTDPVGACLKCHQAAHGHNFPCGDTENPCPLHLIMESKKPMVVQHTHRLASGAMIHAEVSAAPVFDKEGNVVSIIEISRDITDRVCAEEERRKFELHLEQAQKLESLGTLAGGIAHDFNNLLMAIMGNVDLALSDLPASSPVRFNLTEIASVSRHAADLCRQMLAYSGKGQFVITPLCLNDIIVELAHMIEVSISKKAELRYQLADNLPLIDGDLSQIHQILLNLIINASEAIGDHEGIITLSAGSMHCERAYLDTSVLNERLPAGTYVWCEVADTGCGMPPETVKRMFDPFFSTKFIGRGLGLATVIGIVRGHKGAIKVSSTPGLGSTFRILFPVSKAEAQRPLELHAPNDIINGSGTILLVDDDNRIRAIGKIMLERLGYVALLAADGCEAVEIYRNHHADIACVLLDLTMPRMDGAETFVALRQINPNVVVIMSSGYDEQSVSKRFLGQGLAGFIQKPYRLTALGQILHRHIKKD